MSEAFAAALDLASSSRSISMPSATSLFKVSWGRVWRRIAISGQDELDSLGPVIIEAFAFPTKQKRRSDLGMRINMAFVLLIRRPGLAVLR